MMAYEQSESSQGNFSKLIYQLQTTCQETWKEPNKII